MCNIYLILDAMCMKLVEISPYSIKGAVNPKDSSVFVTMRSKT